MIRKATQISVPVIASEELNINSLATEHECAMDALNKLLTNNWKIFSTHTATNNTVTYIVYVLTKIEVEKCEEVEDW